MSYVTVYEITQEAIPLWIPFSFVLFPLFAAIFILLTRDAPIVRTIVKVGMFLLACVWVAFVAYTFHHKHRIEQAYLDGKYKIVEGRVENYSWKGKHECFTVRGVEFCHGTANAVGWEPPLRVGPTTWPAGFTYDGMPVRVAYSDGEYRDIFRLEVIRSSK